MSGPGPRPVVWLLVALVVGGWTGCRDPEPSSSAETATQVAAPTSHERVQARMPDTGTRDVWDVFEHRCVVCHSCYDAPCQLQFVSHEGVARGASGDAVYAAERLTPQRPTRLGIDAHDVQGWSDLGFHDVLGHEQGAAEPGASLLLQMVTLGRAAAFESGARLPDSLPLGIDQDWSCPTADDFADYARKRPRGGMPYGTAPLDESDFERIRDWVAAGAPPPRDEALSDTVAGQMADWERFLNGTTLEERITARYLFEHWFVSQLFFESHPEGPFFRVVRSSTPPGEPVRAIGTRRPYDDPGKKAFWYRLDPLHESIVHKTHIVYPLSGERMARLRSLFLEPDWTATAFPAYGYERASNPFTTYAELPARGRYQFMLDDARHFVMTFIRGPVCHGQVAVDVIEDHFWVAFLDPDQDLSVNDPRYLARAKELLDLPAEEGSLALPFAGVWADHAANQIRYLKLRRELYSAIDPDRKGPALDAIWDGDGHDEDALLTVWRHFDNASVERGLIGSVPETGWVIDYPIFERIYYDLVAGFDVFGNVAHQVATRLYMDHLRMQSENVLLAFLPEAARQPLRDSWYVGATDEVHQRFVNRPISRGHGTQVQFESDDYVRELFEQLRARTPAVAGPEDTINRCTTPPCARGGATELERRAEAELAKLPGRRGPWVRHLPEVAWIRVREGEGADPGAAYTMTHDRAHTNVASMFGEADRLQPALDQVTVFPGHLGSYPNFFFDVSLEELARFRIQLMAVEGPADFEAFVEAFGVRRTDERFWALLDWFHADFARRAPTEAGLIDLGRYHNL